MDNYTDNTNEYIQKVNKLNNQSQQKDQIFNNQNIYDIPKSLIQSKNNNLQIKSKDLNKQVSQNNQNFSDINSQLNEKTCQFFLQINNNQIHEQYQIQFFFQKDVGDKIMQISFEKIEHHFQKDVPFLEPYTDTSKTFIYSYYSAIYKKFKIEKDTFFLKINKQGDDIYEFEIEPQIGVYFIDLSMIEDKQIEIKRKKENREFEKQVNISCITDFTLQIFLKQSFTKFIKFCHQYWKVFKKDIFLSTIQNLQIRITKQQEWDLKHTLMLLYLESINNKSQDLHSFIVSPIDKIISELDRLSNIDNKLVQLSKELQNLYPWKAIPNKLEDIYIKFAEINKCFTYFKLKRVLGLKQGIEDVIKPKMLSAFKPDLQKIFNNDFMQKNNVTSEDFSKLLCLQIDYLRNEKQQFQDYLKQNLNTIIFLYSITDKNQDHYGTLNLRINRIVLNFFKDSDSYTIYKEYNENQKLFASLQINKLKLFQELKVSENFAQIKLEEINQGSDLELLQQFLQDKEINLKIESLVSVLKGIKKMTFNEIPLYYATELVINTIINRLHLLSIKGDQFWQAKQLFIQSLKSLCSDCLSKQDECNKIMACIKFEVWRSNFQRNLNQPLVVEEESMLSIYLQECNIYKDINILYEKLQAEQQLTKQRKEEIFSFTINCLCSRIKSLEKESQLRQELKALNGDNRKYWIQKQNVMDTLIKTADKIIPFENIKTLDNLLMEIYEFLFDVLSQNSNFKNSKFYKQIQSFLYKYQKIEEILWKEYNTILNDHDKFKKFMNIFGLSVVEQKKIKMFSKKINRLKSLRSVLKQLDVKNSDQQNSKLIEDIKSEQYQNKQVKEVITSFDINQPDNFFNLEEIACSLEKSNLFQEIASKHINRQQEKQETLIQIQNEVIPRICLIYNFILKQENINKEVAIVENKIQELDKNRFNNYYQIISNYFKNQKYKDDKELIEQECKSLYKIMKKMHQINEQITAQDLQSFLSTSQERIQDFQLLSNLNSICQNYKFSLQKEFTDQLSNIQQIQKQENVSKDEFLQITQPLNLLFSQFIGDLNNQYKLKLNKSFLDQNFLEFIPSMADVIDLHKKYKNEDMQDLQLDDDPELGERITDYIDMKEQLDKFNDLDIQNITNYIKYLIQFFWKDGINQGIQQKIGDISKHKHDIIERIINQNQSQSINSIKLLEKFIDEGQIQIQVNESFINNSSQKKEKKKNSERLERVQNNNEVSQYKMFYQIPSQKNQIFDEDYIFQMIQRLKLIGDQQLNSVYKDNNDQISTVKERRTKFEALFNQIKKIINLLDQFITEGYLGNITKNITIDFKNKNFQQVELDIKYFIASQDKELKEWLDLVIKYEEKFRVLKLISPTNYPQFYKYFLKLLNFQNEQNDEVNTERSIIITKQIYCQANKQIEYTCEEMMNFFYLKREGFLDQFKNSKFNTIEDRLKMIGTSLSQSLNQQEFLKLLQPNSQNQNQYTKLQVRKIKSKNYGEMCQHLLHYSTSEIKPNRLQFFFGNEDSTSKDIQSFLNRVLFFEISQREKFFLVDFQRLRYEVQQSTLNQIYSYMEERKEEKEQRTKNELKILYLQAKQLDNYQNEEDLWEDQIQVPVEDECQNPSKFFINNLNVFSSDISGKGVGKTFQIQQLIQYRKQLECKIPAHQFSKIDNFLKILRKKRLQYEKYGNQQKAFHLEIIFDPLDRVSLFLYQVIVLNCINHNSNKFFIFPPDSQFYIEKSNYYGSKREYAKILEIMNDSKEYRDYLYHNIKFELQNYQVKNGQNDDDQIMLRYLNGLSQDEKEYFKDQDYAKIDHEQNMTITKEKIFNNQQAQWLITQHFISKLNQTQKENLSFQQIYMFKKQFVYLIKNMEQTYQYTSFYLDLMYKKVNSKEYLEVRNQVRNCIIKSLVEQSFNNTILNRTIIKEEQVEYRKYMEPIISKLIELEVKLIDDKKNMIQKQKDKLWKQNHEIKKPKKPNKNKKIIDKNLKQSAIYNQEQQQQQQRLDSKNSLDKQQFLKIDSQSKQEQQKQYSPTYNFNQILSPNQQQRGNFKEQKLTFCDILYNILSCKKINKKNVQGSDNQQNLIQEEQQKMKKYQVKQEIQQPSQKYPIYELQMQQNHEQQNDFQQFNQQQNDYQQSKYQQNHYQQSNLSSKNLNSDSSSELVSQNKISEQQIYQQIKQSEEEEEYYQRQKKDIYQRYLKVDKRVDFELTQDEQDILQKNQISPYDKQISNLIFFVNQGMIAAIFNPQKISNEMKFLQKLMVLYLQFYNQSKKEFFKHQTIGEIQQEVKNLIPNILEGDEYLLVRTFVNICSSNPDRLIENEIKSNENQLIYKQELNQIIRNTVFSNDNVSKLIQIAYKIKAGIPIVIMGETGIGKTMCVQILAKIMDYKFRTIRVSAGTTVDYIIYEIKQARKDVKILMANENTKHQKVVIFFDEINTNQNINGLMKEIVVDKCINGQSICEHDRIVCIAACNPYEYIYKNTNRFSTGLLTRIQKDKLKKPMTAYTVFPLPESMIAYVVNYEQLSLSNEQNYIKQMLNRVNYRDLNFYASQSKNQNPNEVDYTKQYFTQNELQIIELLIMCSQQFIRYKESSTNSVSLRDVKRTNQFMEFFLQTYFQLRGETNSLKQKQKAVILSLYLSYQIRLSSQDERKQYESMINYQISEHKFCSLDGRNNYFDEIINEELDYFINQLNFNQNLISKNKALKENCFCIAICILNKIPLFITGEPGTSKTLSFAIVMRSFKGKPSSSEFLRNFESITEFYIQKYTRKENYNKKGNLQTQSYEIKDAFEKAYEFLDKKSKKRFSIPVVFFDEIGQAELSPFNPNKVLHELLDEGRTSFIASSNYCLDSAKKNRCLHLQRNKNNLEDLKEFVNQLINDSSDLSSVLLNFCEVYNEYHSDSNQNYIHNTRDFYYTIKYCYRLIEIREKGINNKSVVKNFSGYNYNLKLIIDIFKNKYENKELEVTYDLNKEIFEECFFPKCNDFVYHSRFPMIITKNIYQTLQYVERKLNSQSKEYQIFTGSHFKQDENEDRSKEISQMNSCIEQGKIIISLNQSYVYAIFYDFFTMNFSRAGDKQKFRLNYKQMQNRIEVPQEYIFIMIVSQEQYAQMDLALLNRFEKHLFSNTLILDDQSCQIIKNLSLQQILFIKSQIQNIFKKNLELQKQLPNDKDFFGFYDDDYIQGLVIEYNKRIIKEKVQTNCLSIVGDQCSKYDIIRLKKINNAKEFYQECNEKGYLDNIIKLVEYLKNKDKYQNEGFLSIVYTYSYLYGHYKELFLKINIKAIQIDMKNIQKREQFQEEINRYLFDKENKLMIITTATQDDKIQNIYYLKNFIDQQIKTYNDSHKNLQEKSIILVIQQYRSKDYRLPFCSKWEQFKIDNLLPFIYNETNARVIANKEIINDKLNYRYLHSRNEREILENEPVFDFFINLQSFAFCLLQKLQFQIEPNKDIKLNFYNTRRGQLKKYFSDKTSLIYTNFFYLFKQKMNNNDSQDEEWSQDLNKIKGLNYEKSMINYLRCKVENIILNILVQFEKFNLIESYSMIETINNEDTKQNYLELFDQLVKQNVSVQSEDQLHQITNLEQKHIFSSIIFKQIEKLNNKTEKNLNIDIEVQEYLKIFKNINLNEFSNYIHDFLYLKNIQNYQNKEKDNPLAKFWQQILQNLVQQNFFKGYFNIHELFWHYQFIFQEIVDNLQKIVKIDKLTEIANYLIEEQIFTKKSDISEVLSQYFLKQIYNSRQIHEQIHFIECFLNLFPKCYSSSKFNLVRLFYQNFKDYFLDWDVLLQIIEFHYFFYNQILFEAFNFEESQKILRILNQSIKLKKEVDKNEFCIEILGFLYRYGKGIDDSLESLLYFSIDYISSKNQNRKAFVEIKIMLNYFFKQITEEIDHSFNTNYIQLLKGELPKNIELRFINIFNYCFKKKAISTESMIIQTIIRIGEIIMQEKINNLFDFDLSLIFNVFANFEDQNKYASFQFILAAVYFRLVSPELINLFFQKKGNQEYNK